MVIQNAIKSISGNSGYQFFLRERGSWVLAIKVFNALLLLIINGILARSLSPSQFGEYWIIFNCAIILTMFSKVGIDVSIVRFTSMFLERGDEGAVKKVIAQSLSIVMTVSITIVLVTALFSRTLLAQNLHISMPNATIIALSLWIVLWSLQDTLAEIFRGFQDVKIASILQNFFSNLLLITILLLLYVSKIPFTLSLVLGATVASLFLTNTIGLWFLRKKFSRIPSTDTTSFISQLLNYGWPILIMNLAVFLLTRSSIWMVGVFDSGENVALFGSAMQLVNLVALPLSITNALVPPIISRYHASGDSDKLQSILRSLSTISGIPTTLCLLIFIVFSRQVLGLIFGDFYSNAWKILSILSVGQFVNVYVGSCGITLIMTGHQRIAMFSTIFCGLIFILSAIVLARIAGSMGIAIASASSLAMQNILNLYFVKRRVSIWTHMQLRPMPVG